MRIRRQIPICIVASALVAAGCGEDDSGGTPASGGSAGSVTGGTAGSGTGGKGAMGGGSGTIGTGGTAGAPACEDVTALAEAYKAAHPGNGGKDWDINAKSDAELAADLDAQKLRALCGADQLPVIPLLAWEYGGNDHSWINPQASPSVICVYTPVNPSTAHWQYDAVADHVTADVYLPCPDQNPCNAELGADQILECLGDPSNIEILVDTASRNDGLDVGLSLSEASTDLKLLMPDGTRIHLYTGL